MTSSHVRPLIVQLLLSRSNRKWRVFTASFSVRPITFMFGFRSRGISLFERSETWSPTWNAMTTSIVSKSRLFFGLVFLSTTRWPGLYFEKSMTTS